VKKRIPLGSYRKIPTGALVPPQQGTKQNPALLHDLTAASDSTDYTNLVRVRCMGVVIQTLLNCANKYIGESSLDGLTLVSMQTQLTQDLVGLQTAVIAPGRPSRSRSRRPGGGDRRWLD
jgi:hypothetical protein